MEKSGATKKLFQSWERGTEKGPFELDSKIEKTRIEIRLIQKKIYSIRSCQRMSRQTFKKFSLLS